MEQRQRWPPAPPVQPEQEKKGKDSRKEKEKEKEFSRLDIGGAATLPARAGPNVGGSTATCGPTAAEQPEKRADDDDAPPAIPSETAS